jgi:hypothetical protein
VPNDNLEQVDVAFVNRAEVQINMAVYGLMDWPIIQKALHRPTSMRSLDGRAMID